jgi:hypothetical protein
MRLIAETLLAARVSYAKTRPRTASRSQPESHRAARPLRKISDSGRANTLPHDCDQLIKIDLCGRRRETANVTEATPGNAADTSVAVARLACSVCNPPMWASFRKIC